MTPPLRSLLILAASTAAMGVATAASAEVVENDRQWRVHGPLDRGAVAYRQVERAPGITMVDRGFDGDGGRGIDGSRVTTYGDGALTNDVRQTYANGATASRSGSLAANGDGSVTGARSHTGVAGNTRSGWTTVYRSDDGFGRSRGASSSTGRRATRSTDVQVGDDSVTINRNYTTGSGRSGSRSRSIQRRPR